MRTPLLGIELCLPAHIRLPLVDSEVSLPEPARIAYYLGLGMMAALELVEWPVALIVAVGHEIAARSRSPVVREAAAGVESGA